MNCIVIIVIIGSVLIGLLLGLKKLCKKNNIDIKVNGMYYRLYDEYSDETFDIFQTKDPYRLNIEVIKVIEYFKTDDVYVKCMVNKRDYITSCSISHISMYFKSIEELDTDNLPESIKNKISNIGFNLTNNDDQ